MIRDRIVVGIQNHTLAERMQLDETLDLAKTTKMARENEAIKQQQPELRDKIKQAVDDIQSKGQNKPKRSPLPISSRTQKSGPYRSTSTQPHKTHKVCTRCGNSHPPGKEHCPAKGTKCHKCGKMGHYQRVCRSSINDVTTVSPMDNKFLRAITQGERTVKIQVNKYPILFKIDTGADVTALPSELYRRDQYGPLKQTCMSLVGPSQNTLDVMGCFEAHIEVNKRKVVERVYVVKGLQTPLIGRLAIQKLELVR